MLVKDIQTINELDTRITDLIEQLNNLFNERLEITTDFEAPQVGPENNDSFADIDIDFSTIDLSLN
ncbi:MAG: hypothetical protein WBP12_02735 [Candidatus Saccharimonas sp.]